MKQLPLVETPKTEPKRNWSDDAWVVEEHKGTKVLRSEPFKCSEEVGEAKAVCAITWQEAAKRYLQDRPPHNDKPGVMQAIVRQTYKSRFVVAYRIWNYGWSIWIKGPKT